MFFRQNSEVYTLIIFEKNKSPTTKQIIMRNILLSVLLCIGFEGYGQVTLTSSGNLNVCIGDTVEICVTSNSSASQTYYWSNGLITTGTDSSCISVVADLSDNYSVYSISGVDTSNDVSTLVFGVPFFGWGILDNNGCPPFTVYIDSNTDPDSVATFQWDFDSDGTIDVLDVNVWHSTPVYTLENSGYWDLSVTVTSTNGCQQIKNIDSAFYIYPSVIISASIVSINSTLGTTDVSFAGSAIAGSSDSI